MILIFDEQKWKRDLDFLSSKIQRRSLTTKDVPNLISILCKQGCITNAKSLQALNNLKELLPIVKNVLAEYYNVSAKSVFIGDFTEEDCPYSIVIGDIYGKPNNKYGINATKQLTGQAKALSHTIKKADNLKVLIGDFNYPNNKEMLKLPNIEIVTGNMLCDDSNLAYMPNLRIVGGNAYFRNTPIKNFTAQYVGGYLDVSYSNIERANNLDFLGGNYNTDHCPLFADDDKLKIAKSNFVIIEDEKLKKDQQDLEFYPNIEAKYEQPQKESKLREKMRAIKEKLLNE